MELNLKRALVALFFILLPLDAHARRCNRAHPCVTPTNTPFATATTTPTFTPTPTATFTPTGTLTPTNTPTSTSTFTQVPTNTPTPTSTITNTPTPTNTVTPTFTPTRTPAFAFFPLSTVTPAPTCTAGQTAWYGQCSSSLKIFGQSDIFNTGEGLVGPTKGYNTGSVAIDKSVKPNRVYILDQNNNRILGYSALGTCTTGGGTCTNDTDCTGGSTPPCVINPTRTPDIVIGQSSLNIQSACNRDNNIGIHGKTSATSLCLQSFPDNTNPAESFYTGSLEVDVNGALYVADRYNHRVLRYTDPFVSQTADLVYGQPDFTTGGSGLSKVGYNIGDVGVTPPSATSVDFGANATRTGSQITVDAAGNLWIADTGHQRVLRVPVWKGQTSADLVLGQPDPNHQYSDRCYNVTPSTQPLSVLCMPIMARINEATGDLWVMDGGGGTFNTRFLIFHPPFTQNMSAASEFVVNLTNITTNSGSKPYQGFTLQSFIFNTYTGVSPYNTGVVWVSEYTEIGCSGSGRVLLLDSSGNVVKQVNATAADSCTSPAGVCGNVDTTYIVQGPGGLAQDDASNLFIADSGHDYITRYSMPTENYTINATTCPPKIAGGVLALGYQNPTTANTIARPGASFAYGGQLGVWDFSSNKLRIWDNYTTASIGTNPNRSTTNFFVYGQIAADDLGHLWVDSQAFGATPAGAYAISLPILTTTPTLLGGTLYWNDDDTPITYTHSGLNHVAFDPLHHHLWIADPSENRIFRISDYGNVGVSHVHVDMVIGQTSKVGTSCNKGTPASPTASSLCSGGPMAVDSLGNLYVADAASSNGDTQCGNTRILRYNTADIEAAATLFPNISAAATYLNNTGNLWGTLTTKGVCTAETQGETLAADTSGRLYFYSHYLGGYSFGGPGRQDYWSIGVLSNPLTSTQIPDKYLLVPSGFTWGLSVDRQNNNLIAPTNSRAVITNLDTDPGMFATIPAFTFTLNHDGNQKWLQAGNGTAQFNFSASAPFLGTFSPITYSISGLPSGMTASFIPTTTCTALPCNGSVLISAASTVPFGSYQPTISLSTSQGYKLTYTVRITVGGPLTCFAQSPQVLTNTDTLFFASGGNGQADVSFNWSAPGATTTTYNGVRFLTRYTTTGVKTVTVSDQGSNQTASCSVTVN